MRSSPGSITVYLDQLRDGNPDAIRHLWKRYFERLIRLARGRLRSIPGLAAYDEDVALNAMASFFRAVEHGRFPDLRDRTDLWHILLMLTHRKAHALRRRKRLPVLASAEAAEEILGALSCEPTAKEAIEIAEECEHRLDLLKDSTLRRVALWKLEGFSNEEIAERLGCVPRTVERKLHAIRDIWKKEPPP